MCKVDPLVRLAANNNGETKCVVFVDSLSAARESLTRFSSSIVGAYPFISAFGAHVSLHTLTDLMNLPCVKAIASHSTVTTLSLPYVPYKISEIKKCEIKNSGIELTALPPSEKLPYAVSVYGAGIFGTDVNTAVIDTGISPHLDFCMPSNRLMFVDFINGEVNPYDDNGHGTAVASILCGNGLLSNTRFRGVAPKAGIIGLKAIGANGEGGAFAILEAMQWVYENKDKYKIKVVCMSFGSDPVINAPDPLALGAKALWQSGLVVVASAGNDGPRAESIKSPGICSDVITVGGVGFNDDGSVYLPDFSSRGPILGINKPDIAAPAVDIACCALKNGYLSLSGTSMAAPIVAGAAALTLSKNSSLKPDRIKELLLSNALPLPFGENESGRGLLNLSFLTEK